MVNHEWQARASPLDPSQGTTANLKRKPEAAPVPQQPSTSLQPDCASLNFVFETGSGLRSGGRSVRSQAAKHGWTNRQRVVKTDCPPKPKRRKVQQEMIGEGTSSHQPSAIVPSFLTTSSPPSSLSGHCGPHAPKQPRNATSLQASNSRPAASTPPLWLPHLRGTGSLPTPASSPPQHNRAPFHESENDTAERSAIISSYPKRPTSPFLHVVLNEECPLFTQVDQAGNPFQAYPVQWKPLYGTMVEHCRSEGTDDLCTD